ncbi:MAG: hypothetical protein Q8941_02375 [Bacteroidota bacterium]|nr:hypothetical protein [Bacteroidota bacterium]
MTKRTIVFIHGLWIHACSWQPWMDLFNQHGSRMGEVWQRHTIFKHAYTKVMAEALQSYVRGIGRSYRSFHIMKRVCPGFITSFWFCNYNLPLNTHILPLNKITISKNTGVVFL